MDPILIQRIVEAALLASSHPLSVAQLQGLFPIDEPAPEGSIAQAIEALQADHDTRGVELVEVASGWRYQVRADVHPWVARLWTERQTKYTRATLETLALIAYRQPITRGEIEQVRGVSVNSNIIKALEEREWIRVVGHRDVPGRPELLGTTRGFLDYFGLKRLDDLPPLSELKDFGELDPQLRFEGTPVGEPLAIGNVAGGTDAGVDADDVDADDEDRTNDSQSGTKRARVVADQDQDHAMQPDDFIGSDVAVETDSANLADEAQPRDDDASTDARDPTHSRHDDSQDDSNDPALADDGDSNGARHD